MLRYSPGALTVRPRFYSPYNDVTIVVEDTNAENLYTTIFEKIFGNTVRIKNVLGMGGKTHVIERYQNRMGLQSSPPEIYLVDGDFDEIVGRSCPASATFYRLKRYDIESFLVEERAICLLVEEEKPLKNAHEHGEILQLSEWKREVIDRWHHLAACAALIQESDGPDINMQQNATRYTTGNDALPDIDKIEQEIDRVKRNQPNIRRGDFDRLLAQMQARMGQTHRDRIRWISGKNVLIPLTIKKLNSYTRRNFSKESLCFRLAKNCEFRDLTEFRDLVTALLVVEEPDG